MSVVKYQAWDKERGRMIDWKELLSYGSGLAEYLAAPRELIFLQSTGLFDATKWSQLNRAEKREWLQTGDHSERDWKGKEIHEGDIVKYVGDQFENGLAVMEWIPDEACFALNDGNTFNDIGPENLRVVGTIYENPELVSK